MVVTHQNLNGPLDLSMPLSGIACHPWASTCCDQPSLSIEFEFSIFTHYEDTKGDTKYRKLGGLG